MKQHKGWLFFFCCLCITEVFASVETDCGLDAEPCVKYGASVFQTRCVLCHGSEGLGDGILPLSLGKYPATNLLSERHQLEFKRILEVITYGGGLPDVNAEMPPWGEELTDTELNSVALFVDFLRKDQENAKKILHRQKRYYRPSLAIGNIIYKGHCLLCHGRGGKGNGLLARIIKTPSPSDLTQSTVPDYYLRQIISKGGKAMNRSERMPPFAGDLSENEIRSVIMHLKFLRQ